MTPIEGGTPVNPIRKPPRPGSTMNELIRERKDHRNRQTEARQDRFFRDPPEDPDIAALREQAATDREESASLRRRAEAARKRAGS